MSVRDDLAAAANTVEGITAHPYFLAGTAPGHTLVRHERTDYPNRFGGVVRWNVVVLLPQDLDQAEHYIEDKAPALRAALAPHLAVDSLVPQRIEITGYGVLPALFINGHREDTP